MSTTKCKTISSTVGEVLELGGVEDGLAFGVVLLHVVDYYFSLVGGEDVIGTLSTVTRCVNFSTRSVDTLFEVVVEEVVRGSTLFTDRFRIQVIVIRLEAFWDLVVVRNTSSVY